ncbi:hypothetical protein [Pseudomonas silensiensis]|uniref:hypothetical protein n=1 Tax=Pseudomonas silensiensis TaxID=2991049 RepID=UPI003D1EFB4A
MKKPTTVQTLGAVCLSVRSLGAMATAVGMSPGMANQMACAHRMGSARRIRMPTSRMLTATATPVERPEQKG